MLFNFEEVFKMTDRHIKTETDWKMVVLFVTPIYKTSVCLKMPALLNVRVVNKPKPLS